MKKLTIYVDMDGVVADFDSVAKNHPNSDTKSLSEIAKEIDFSILQPMPGAIDAVNELVNMGHNVYFASTAPWDNPNSWTQKRIWIGQYFPQLRKRLILTAHKNLLKGDILIDDHLWNGAKDFEGEHILFGKLKRVNNLGEWKTKDWRTWDSVMKYIKNPKRTWNSIAYNTSSSNYILDN